MYLPRSSAPFSFVSTLPIHFLARLYALPLLISYPFPDSHEWTVIKDFAHKVRLGKEVTDGNSQQVTWAGLAKGAEAGQNTTMVAAAGAFRRSAPKEAKTNDEAIATTISDVALGTTREGKRNANEGSGGPVKAQPATICAA